MELFYLMASIFSVKQTNKKSSSVETRGIRMGEDGLFFSFEESGAAM